jgi:hypothetical protein
VRDDISTSSRFPSRSLTGMNQSIAIDYYCLLGVTKMCCCLVIVAILENGRPTHTQRKRVKLLIKNSLRRTHIYVYSEVDAVAAATPSDTQLYAVGQGIERESFTTMLAGLLIKGCRYCCCCSCKREGVNGVRTSRRNISTRR